MTKIESRQLSTLRAEFKVVTPVCKQSKSAS